jgi:hypothetical protein
MNTFLGGIFGTATTKKPSALEKRVAEVNKLINEGNKQGLEVVDSSSTWQAPMKYKPLKTSRGVLYVTYEKLDLYKYNRGKGTSWEKKSERWGTEDAKYILNDIAKMYRKAIKTYSVYGY